MATRNKTRKIDGRLHAAKLLCHMGQINERRYVNVAESRKALYRALSQFQDLPLREQERFSAVLNEYIGTVMQGTVLDADAFMRQSVHQLEGYSLAESTRFRAERRHEQLAQEATHA